MMSDLTELRREVEQVRNEVRRVEEPSKQSEKNAVLLSWLVDTVKELQSEVRALETKVGLSDSSCDQAEQIRLLREELEQLRDREEENRVALQHLENIVQPEVRVNMTTISDKLICIGVCLRAYHPPTDPPRPTSTFLICFEHVGLYELVIAQSPVDYC